jgi:molecular chaperone GrpE
MKKTNDQGKQVVEAPIAPPVNDADEWKMKYMRVLADYQNLEKRTNERVSEVRQYAAEVLLTRLLPVVDTFGKVNEHLKDTGLTLAYKELLSVLTEQGVEHIDVLEKPFDPTEMDCIEVVDGKDDTVVEEVQPGYRFRGKVLRVARVKVGKSQVHTN